MNCPRRWRRRRRARCARVFAVGRAPLRRFGVDPPQHVPERVLHGLFGILLVAGDPNWPMIATDRVGRDLAGPPHARDRREYDALDHLHRILAAAFRPGSPSRSGEPGRNSLNSYDYMQTLDVPFQVRPARSHVSCDVYCEPPEDGCEAPEDGDCWLAHPPTSPKRTRATATTLMRFPPLGRKSAPLKRASPPRLRRSSAPLGNTQTVSAVV